MWKVGSLGSLPREEQPGVGRGRLFLPRAPPPWPQAAQNGQHTLPDQAPHLCRCQPWGDAPHFLLISHPGREPWEAPGLPSVTMTATQNPPSLSVPKAFAHPSPHWSLTTPCEDRKGLLCPFYR